MTFSPLTNLVRWLAVLALIGLLSGCLYPEKFTLDVVFEDDGSVNLTFDGSVFAEEALMQMRDGKRSLTANEDATMHKVAEALAKRMEIQSAKYIGNGRFQVKAQRGARGNDILMDMPVFGVLRDTSGNTDVLMATGSQAEPIYKVLGVKPDGVIRITIPDKAKVLTSSKEPSRSMILFGKRTVTWNYKLGAEERMRLRF